MNASNYLEAVKNLFLADPRITAYKILREYAEDEKSYIRARLTLADETFLEISEMITLDANHEIVIHRYSYHWATRDGKLLRRWDNSTHHPQLKNFPHHIHNGQNEVQAGAPINIFGVLDEISKLSRE
jgi:hypothetical protein